MNRLAGKVAVVTGAGSGIGRATARMFAAESARVVVAELNEELGRSAAEEAGVGARFVRTDVTSEHSVLDMVQACLRDFGTIDVLVNCAGGSLATDSTAVEVDLSVWDHTISLDMKGPFLCCRHVVPVMVRQAKGSIVNFSSVAALRGSFGNHVYAMAKGGLISFTRALASAYSAEGVRVNAIAPGLVLTDRVRDRTVGQVDALAATHPFAVGEPTDIANIALFLASDDSRMINGALIPAEGGLTAY